MAELKTKPTDESVEDFIDGLAEERKRQDAKTLLHLMQEVSGCSPKMWGASIVGFGGYHYVYESGREGDWFVIGFSPRKDALTLYLSCSVEKHAAILKDLGRHKTGKGCLYLRRLDDVNMDVLRDLLRAACEEHQQP